MKHVSLHYEDYTSPFVMFMIGNQQVLTCFVFEMCNIYVLYQQTTMVGTLASFVSVSMIIKLHLLYLNVQKMDKQFSLNGVMATANFPYLKRKTSELDWSTYPLKFKICRGLFKFWKTLYVSIIFYFVPFIFTLGFWFFPNGLIT